MNMNISQEFQSTLPHGERRAAGGYAVYVFVFQSTLPHGERQMKKEERYIAIIFQSTLPHGERRPPQAVKVRLKNISIHAPTRGATDSDNMFTKSFEISIHAPTRGATLT